MNWIMLAVVIFITSTAVMLGFGWLLEHSTRELERARLLDEFGQATTDTPQLPRAGYLPGPAFAGAQDPAYQLAPIPWDLALAAYELGQQRTRQDDVSAEVDAMFAEWEAQRGEG